jgi:hypothetical protein
MLPKTEPFVIPLASYLDAIYQFSSLGIPIEAKRGGLNPPSNNG